ncbi:MAG: energy-coupling factor transporter ATPase [Nitrososphaerales archaeon]|nr:energy-coupling factor transporter ATPase [Nitrososphaerales archaeon]
MRNPVIDVRGLTYWYPYSVVPVLKDVNLTVNEGEFVLLLGPSACGKTTLCLTFNGIIPHALGGQIEGEIVVRGRRVIDSTVSEMATQIGLVLQDYENQLIHIYVEDEVAFAPENLNVPEPVIRRRIRDSLDIVGLSGSEERYVHHLSGGEKQRLALASVLAMEPKILVLDEPTSNLDPSGTAEFFKAIHTLRRERDVTLVVVEHKVDEIIQNVDRVIVMDEGRIMAEGDPRKLFNETGEFLSQELGVWIPQPSELALGARKRNFAVDPFPLTVEEACQVFRTIPLRDYVAETQVFSAANERPTIEVKNLSYAYPTGPFAIKQVSVVVQRGEFVALVGANGSGKTTLAKLLVGLIKPPPARVFIGGLDASYMTVGKLAEKVGYVFQNPDHQFLADSVFDEVVWSLRFRERGSDARQKSIKDKVAEVLELCQLKGLEERNPFSLSVGQRRRLSIASMLALDQDVMILDEPTIGQDKANVDTIGRILSELNRNAKTVVVITHDMRFVAEYARSVTVLHEGGIIYHGSVTELFQNAELLTQASLRQPTICTLIHKLRGVGLKVPPTLLTLNGLLQVIGEKP